MPIIRFRVNTSAFVERLDQVRDRIVAALEQQAGSIAAQLQREIVKGKLGGNPIKQHTGKLAGSVRIREVANDGQKITAGVQAGGGVAPYAKYLEFGTSPHDIFPRNKKALAFLKGDTMIFAKQVHHPGTPAFQFMSSTLEENRENIRRSLITAIREALTK